MGRKRDRRPTEATTETKAARAQPPPKATRVRAAFDDDRPTEVYSREPVSELAYSKEQLITGSTIREMMNNPKHNLSAALTKLLRRARRDLPQAEIDARASLSLRHDFEFERRVGYRLKLKLFDRDDRCVEVVAEVDQDGKAIRRGSMASKLIPI